MMENELLPRYFPFEGELASPEFVGSKKRLRKGDRSEISLTNKMMLGSLFQLCLVKNTLSYNKFNYTYFYSRFALIIFRDKSLSSRQAIQESCRADKTVL